MTVNILCKVSFTATNLQAQRGLVQRHTSLGKGHCMGAYVVLTLLVVSSEFPPHPPATVRLMMRNGVLPMKEVGQEDGCDLVSYAALYLVT